MTVALVGSTVGSYQDRDRPMHISNSGNERFYHQVVSTEVSAQEAHNALCAANTEAFDRFFTLSSEFGEPYVRENFPDMASAVDRIYASSGHLQEMRSSPRRYEALIESLVAEMKELGTKGEKADDPIVRLRSDLAQLSTFRFERLDGVKVDFWLNNVQRRVSLMDKNGFSAPAIVAWCKLRKIKPKILEDALATIAPLFDEHPYKPLDTISTLSSALNDYPFDAFAVLEEAKAWPEANPELVEGVIAAREVANSMSPGR